MTVPRPRSEGLRTSLAAGDAAEAGIGPDGAGPDGDEGRALENILALVAERRGVDFRDYRRDTVQNLLRHRMRAIGCASAAAYLSLLSADSPELDRLLEALVIPVTSFFRDPQVFLDLAERVLPALMDEASFVRAWVAGSATGEEAYTVAILLAEAGAQQRGAGFEVIASDIDQRSLEIGRAGLYPASALETMPAKLRGRYLRREAGGFRVVDSIRGRVRFGQHDLVGNLLAPKEAVVAAFDAVFCRNVLMYFDASLRAKAAQRLAAVLDPRGVLVVGLSESVPAEVAGQLEEHPAIGPGRGVFRKRSR